MMAKYGRSGDGHITLTSPTLDSSKKACMTFWYNMVVSIFYNSTVQFLISSKFVISNTEHLNSEDIKKLKSSDNKFPSGF